MARTTPAEHQLGVGATGGQALGLTFATACGGFDCGVDFKEHLIQLKGGKH